jgi:hypothetical protein
MVRAHVKKRMEDFERNHQTPVVENRSRTLIPSAGSLHGFPCYNNPTNAPPPTTARP